MPVATSNLLLEAAQSLALLGWAVFPCHSMQGENCSCGSASCSAPAKHPRTANGFVSATTDPVQITKWWSQYPGANIAVATGAPSGLCVLDFDGPEAVEVSMRFADAATVRAETGSGGRHLFYAYPEGRPTASRVKADKGIDVRASGGYVIVAPSNHRSGSPYRWLRKPDSAVLQPVPEELRYLLRDVRPKELPGEDLKDATPEIVERARRYLKKIDGAVQGSGGSVATLKAAVAMVRGFLLTPPQAYELLAGEYNDRCSPPWSRAELKHKIEDAFLSSPIPFGYLLELPEPPAPAMIPAEDRVLEAEIISTTGIKPLENKTLFDLLETSASGLVKSTLRNSSQILALDNLWNGILRLDLFSDQVFWVGVPPIEDFNPAKKLPCILTEEDYLAIICWLSKNYSGMNLSREIVYHAVRLVASRRPFHQVRDYLEAQVWDGTPRLGRWLVNYMGADDDDYTRAVGQRWLVSAVARAFQPGCEAHHALVLESEEGTGKSRAFEILGRPWTRSNMPMVGSKDSYIQLRGAWIIELAELASVTRADSESVKAFLSAPRDAYRKPFAIDATDVPRQCVFGGSTNQAEYLKSETGNRRFWPVRISDDPVKLKELEADRGQIWAEAVALYRTGMPWWIEVDEKELAETARGKQLDRLVSDPWDELVRPFLEGRLKDYASTAAINRKRPPRVTMGEVCSSLGIAGEKRGRADAIRIGLMMARFGWRVKRVRGPHGLEVFYEAANRLWRDL